MMQFIQYLTMMSIFDSFTQPIGDLFRQILGSDLLIGIFIFLVVMLLVFIFGLGFLVGSVVLIPAMFLIFQYIPPLRIIFAIVMGLFVGLGLHRLIRR